MNVSEKLVINKFVSHILSAFISIFLLIGAPSETFAAFWNKNKPIETITFATSADYPPFESVKDNGEFVGFDIDIARAVCKTLEVKCKFINYTFINLFSGIDVGHFDAAIAAILINKPRSKFVDFSNPYFPNTANLLSREKIQNKYLRTALINKRVGVPVGSVFEYYLLKYLGEKVDMVRYDNIPAALRDFESGNIDVVMLDAPFFQMWLSEKQQPLSNIYYMLDSPIEDDQIFGIGNGIAVKKGNKKLLDKINFALKQIEEDGTYGKIILRYFSR